jgi:hypothetical protein
MAANPVPPRRETALDVVAGFVSFTIFGVLVLALVILLLPAILLLLFVWACLAFLLL